MFTVPSPLTKRIFPLAISALLIFPLMFSAFPAMAENALPSGLSDNHIAETIDGYVSNHMETTAGMSVAIARGQETIFQKAYGYANIDKDARADDDSVYEWGSVTKLLVWVSVMQLVEEGKIDLNGDIAQYLPEGFFTKLKYDDPITMLNLMHHNAGWEDIVIGVFVPYGEASADLGSTLRRMEPAQIYQPGAVCAYSNWGVALAGYIVERVSGMPFYEYAGNHIFAPLGMERTGIHPLLEDNPWVKERRARAQGYSIQLEPLGAPRGITLYPAGMATGTLGDLMRFAKALMPDPGTASPLFSDAETLSQLQSPSMRYDNGDPRNCHGFWVREMGVPTIGHGGNTLGFSAYLSLDLTNRVAMAVMVNQAQETVYTIAMQSLVFGRKTFAEASPLPDARPFQGFYESARITKKGCGRLLYVTGLLSLSSGDENTLNAAPLGETTFPLRQVAPGVFQADGNEAGLFLGPSHMESSSAGGTRIALPYFDYIRATGGERAWAFILLGLFAASILFCATAFFGNLLRRLALRLRRRRLSGMPLRWAHLLMCLLGLGVGVNTAIMVVQMAAAASPGAFLARFGYNIAYCAMAVGYTVLLIVKQKAWRGNGPRHKLMLGATWLTSLAFVANILYWQLYLI